MLLPDFWRRRLSLLKRSLQRRQPAGKGQRRREKELAVWQATASSQSGSSSLRKVVVVGHSHMNALSRAARASVQSDEFPDDLSMSFIHLRSADYSPNIVRRTAQLNPALINDIKRYSDDADLIVSCIGGNSHHVMGLLNHPRPYDFILDVDPAIPFVTDRELVPCALVRAALKKRMEGSLGVLALIRAEVRGTMVHLETPPPIASEEHIRANPGKFAERIGSLGISPAGLRLKLWTLQSDVYRRFCSENGIVFLPAPPEAFDDNGMLSESAWSVDSTHGNSWYGKCVIEQIQAFMNDAAKVNSTKVISAKQNSAAESSV